jgi:inner membrane protein involved in colicin E2 resistance
VPTGYTSAIWSITTGVAGGGTGFNANGQNLGVNSNDFTRVVFRGADGYQAADLWSVDLNIVGEWNTNVLQSQFIGPLTITGNGITVSDVSIASGILNITDSNLNFKAVGFTYGANCQGVTIKGTNFTNDNIGIFVPAGASGQDQLIIDSCQFGPSTSTSIAIDIVGTMRDFKLANSLIFVIPSTTGVSLSNVNNVNITGNTFSGQGPGPSTSNGISVGSNNADNAATITGNGFFNLAAAVILAAGTTGWNVQANSYTSVTTPVANSSGSNSVGVATK